MVANPLSDDFDELVDFDQVKKWARAGLKDPELIAIKMGVPFSVFEMCMDDVRLAIREAMADLSIESVRQIRENAASGDFQAQKYILQNVDESWSDRKETVTKHEVDISKLPSLEDMFRKGIEALEHRNEKTIDGEFREIDND